MPPILLLTFNIITLIVTHALSLLDSKKIPRPFPIIIISTIATTFISSRDLNHGDSLNYKLFFQNLEPTDNFTFEPLFEILSRFLKFVLNANEVQIFQTITFITIYLLIHSASLIIKKKDSFLFFYCISCLFSFYYLNFEVIREALSLSIFLFGYAYYIEKNSKKIYFLFGILSALVHYSSLALLIAPIIIKLKNRTIYIIAIICFFSAYVITPLLINLIPETDFLILMKLSFYSELSSESKTILIRIIIFTLCIPIVLKYSKNHYLNSLFITLTLQAILLIPIEEACRRSLFKIPIFLTLIAFSTLEKYQHKIILSLCFGMYFLFFLMHYKALEGILNINTF